MKIIENIKVIIVDLDRTLLRSDKTISQYTVAILKRCKQRGIKIFVATARPQRDVIQFLDTVGFDGLVVSNGARILCGDRRTELCLPIDSAERLLKAWSNIPTLRITLETGDCAYSNRFIEDYPTVICNNLIEVARAEGVLKLLAHIDNNEIFESVKIDLTDDLHYSVAHGYLLQVMDRSATKWNGVKTMLQSVGCATEEAVYFGDDQDDLEPIQMCGVGVAVSNAISEVKEAADYIAGSNDDDGVAEFIEKHILCDHINQKKYTIDFRNINCYSEIHKVIKESLNFPNYYGCNWSAFWDCLTDLYGEPIHIEIVGFDVIERKFEDAAEQIVNILKRFKHYEESFEKDIQIELISGNKRIEIE